MKSFSELTSASQVNNGDLVAISQSTGNGYASKKTTVKDITDKSNLNLADEYDSTSTYAVDDYVIYESVLYKCIASTTGTFDSAKWTSVVVTDEMGSGGGGGTGGHTIIDENGNLMPARAGLQFVGGANVSDDSTNNKTIVDVASAGGIDGVFIDTGNVIQATTNIVSGTTASYTATEDCYVALWAVVGNDTNVYAYIDNVEVVRLFQYSAGTVIQKYLLPLKKGQTFTATTSYSSVNSNYTVYGIQTGTTNSKFQPIIYSLEEREIGVWTDGKPLYEKTLAIPSLSAGSNTIQHNIANFDKMVSCQGRINYDGDDLVVPYMQTQVTSGYVAYGIGISNFNSTRYFIILGNMFDVSKFSDGYVTVRYTKTTDVVGSGSWTPQGVPAVHYSLDEQVIGTWMGETLYQRSYDFSANPIDLSANSWTNTTASNSGIDKIINNEAVTSDGININWLGANGRTGNYIQLLNIRNSTIGIAYLTIQYTKSS